MYRNRRCCQHFVDTKALSELRNRLVPSLCHSQSLDYPQQRIAATDLDSLLARPGFLQVQTGCTEETVITGDFSSHSGKSG